jgi:alpha-mannosidase
MPDGTFGNLIVEPGGRELLAPGGRGNALSASAPDGEPLARSVDGPATLDESDLGRLVRVRGTLGPRVRTVTEIRFVRGMRRIDIRLDLTFDEAAIGDFFDDDTKLAVSWPLGFDGAIHHDIPFGSVRTRPGRPFFPVSWTDVSDGVRGFGLLTRGTPRHRLTGRTLSNVIGWGGFTDRIGNRAESVPRPWPKAFDQLLRGTHRIEYALLPHDGTWVASGIVQEARRWNTPLHALVTSRHPGNLPPALTALTVGPAGIVPTAVIPVADGVLVRMYEAAGSPTKPRIAGDRFARGELKHLDGTPVETLGPFRIALARCADA